MAVHRKDRAERPALEFHPFILYRTRAGRKQTHRNPPGYCMAQTLPMPKDHKAHSCIAADVEIRVQKLPEQAEQLKQ